VTLNGVLRRRNEFREAAPSDGLYTADDVEWHLPAAQLAFDPAPGAVLVDASGARFVMLAVEQQTLGSRWLCRTRSLAIESGLAQQVLLQQATWTKGASGAQLPQWRDVRVNLAARIQPEQGEISIEYDRRLTRVTHRIFLADDLVLDHTYRFVAGTDAYRVLGYERPERIDALVEVLVAQTSGGIE